MKRPIVFDYLNFQEYLTKIIEFTKLNNRKFSHRQFAKLCGFKSSGTLLGVLNHGRLLSEEKVKNLARGLKLSDPESIYFVKLSRLERAKNPIEAESIRKELDRERKFFELQKLTEAQSIYYSDWRIPMIREFISAGANTRPLIKARSVWKLEEDDLDLALGTLENLGFIYREAETFKTVKQLVASPLQMDAKELVDYHKSLLELSQRSLEVLPREQRDLRAGTMSIDSNRFEALRVEVNNFLRYIVDKYEGQTSVSDMTVQMNIQSIVLGLDVSGVQKQQKQKRPLGSQ
jgi:uncharacterized protein (TIGR02147 family)